MRKTIVALAIVILLMSSFPTIVFAAPPDNSAPVSDLSSSQQILVKFRPGTGLPEATQIHRQLGGQVKETISDIGVQVITVPKGQANEKVKAYRANARVAYAEPDFVAKAAGSPDDPLFGYQWGLSKVEAPQAWGVTTGNSSIKIAILDTGVDSDHPDLAGKIVSNINFSGSNTTDDVYGHGTHVAGIAAAVTNNGIGVAGLGYSSTIMNVKVLGDDGVGYWSWVAQGIIWAADHGAQIINLSLGGSDTSSTLEDAINYAWNKGVVVIAAAGNNGNSSPFYPAYYPNCIAIAATDANDALAPWSNRGDWVDVAAPGVSVYSTMTNGGYWYMSGTSMASPHVAGLAALVFTTVSDTNGDGKLNDEVRSRIEATCDDISVTGIGHGRIDAARAVSSALVPPGTVSGQVTDAKDGSAISGAQVSDGTRTTLTDALGSYSIGNVPRGSYQVTASKDGYQSSSLTVNVVSGGTTVANFSLSQIVVPGSITGSVTDAKDGAAIVGATVSDGTRTATTDASGKYTITAVPPGTYQVTASKSGYQSSSLTVNVFLGGTTVANFPLSQILTPGSITGSVTDAKDGSAISGAQVSAGTRTVTTDASGKYTVANVPPGTYGVVASKAGYQNSSLTVNVFSGGTTVASFSLSQSILPGSITGSVTDAKDGSPIVGAVVNDGTRTATTDATGKYTVANVPPGTYQVVASREGYQNSSLTVSVLSGATALANLSLSQIILPGSITGSVTNAKDGSPIVGAAVSDGTRTATADATGKYTIADVPPGSYQVTASKEGYQTSFLTVSVLQATTTVASFSLSQIILPGSITGSITNAKDGSPIVGATVSDGNGTALTDALGSYTIGNVTPGTYQVTASKLGYQSSYLTVSVVSGTTALANFSLSQIILPGSITGSITNAKDGSPIVGAVVNDGTSTTSTDATGKYTIANVPPGTYVVVASKAGYQSSSLTVNVFSEGTTVANFSLNEIIVPGSISGTVTSAKDGLPLVGATVTDGTRTTSTDATGKYTIANVPPGTYQVVASKEGYETSSLTVNVLQGTTAVANFSLSQIIVPGSITGAVTNAKDGSPIVGVAVNDGTRTALTDATGSYTIDNVTPGGYQVVASKEGYQSSSLTGTVLSGTTAVANLCLSQIILPGSITGAVTDAKDGSPIVGAAVNDGTRTTTTDATGKYTIADVPPGSYQITASKEGYQTSSLTVSVLQATTAVANFSLSQIILPGSITGAVTDAKDGSPIVGAAVTDGTRTATTDATGKYTVSDAPPGTYQVVASKEGYESSSLTVNVLLGTTAVANFSLSQIILPGRITGSVTNVKNGLPIVGAAVTDGTRTATTDATGKYTIANVPPDTYRVTASKEGSVSVTSAVTVVSGGTVMINFSLSPRAPAMWVDSIRFIKSGKNLIIEVKVVTASGVFHREKVGLRLECSNGKVWSFSSTTNTAGLVRFNVSRAPVGSYLATVNSLICSGFIWDKSKGITSASYAPALYASHLK
jgi:subtilisin family serine protease/protocatechuate 3,4-dioxygenase beta subunit